jgi:hypothetical protein
MASLNVKKVEERKTKEALGQANGNEEEEKTKTR